MRLTSEQLNAVKALLNQAVDDADAEIIDALRRNDGKQGSRENLLTQLDVLETVRERLNVRYDRATYNPDRSHDIG